MPEARRLLERTELELVGRAQHGDHDAFEELVRAHAHRLLVLLRRLGLDPNETEEVAQETLLRAWRSLPRFEARSSFFTWLHRIAFNEAQRRLARRAGNGETVQDVAGELDVAPDRAVSPQDRAEQHELRQALDAALSQLPMELRSAVILRDVEELSTQEAARLLQLSEAAFKSRLHRGRSRLRQSLAPYLLPS